MIVLISFLPLCIETSHKKINIIEKKVIIYSVSGIGMSKILANGRQKTVKWKEMSVYLSAALPQAILDPHLSYLSLTYPIFPSPILSSPHISYLLSLLLLLLWNISSIALVWYWNLNPILPSPILSSLLTLHINGFQSIINQSII